MTPIRYVSTVIQAMPPYLQPDIQECLRSKDEAAAKEILSHLNEEAYPTSHLRFRLTPVSLQDQLIKTIFAIAIKNQKVLNATKVSTYPLGKRVIYIVTPRVLSAVIGNIFFKIVISTAITIYTISRGHRAYRAIIPIVAPGIALIVNHTPFLIVRIANTAKAAMDYIYNNPLRVFIPTAIGREFILQGPEIPYLTVFVRSISPRAVLWALIQGPQTTGDFLFAAAENLAFLGWNGCNTISYFFRDSADKSEKERLGSIAQHGCTYWKESLNKIDFAQLN